jgi:AcrR family transcriptional regulator
MAPEERRAALVAATIPLLREHGLDVTTRQIAQAAGVAEGTIFGVFPDKTSLIHAAVMEVLDPQGRVTDVDEIDRTLDLRARLTVAAERMRDSFTRNATIFASLRTLAFSSHDPEFRKRMLAGRERAVQALAELIEPDRALLRREPSEVAGFLLLLIGATGHGAFGNDPYSADELVSILLDGMLTPHDDNHDQSGGALRC